MFKNRPELVKKNLMQIMHIT